ncbi:hypothetical protein A4J70_30600, partial [Salmonella enterica subsp. enterica serovar Typhimurium]|nr:hypothetical protein [Salmonella enterica subsp. enterica serovar Typhimurium]
WQRGLPRYNIYATLRRNNKSVLYSFPAMGSVAGKETPLSLPGISSLCHILCVIYSQACIELVDKITV